MDQAQVLLVPQVLLVLPGLARSTGLWHTATRVQKITVSVFCWTEECCYALWEEQVLLSYIK